MSSNSTPNVFPVFRYRDAQAAIDFLEQAFGFEKQAVHDAPDGSVAHAELRLGSGIVGLSSAGPEVPGNPWTTVRDGMHVSMPEVDAHHERARAAGAEIVRPLQDMDYGSRDYSARDLEGHLWNFGTYPMGDTGAATPDLFVGLHYRQGSAAIEWLERAFGFTTRLLLPGADGTVDHAELGLGRGVVMISSAPKSKGLWTGDSQATYVAVSDPDAHFARAKAAGARVVQEPKDTPYGSRGYYARDPEGFLWGFSTYRPAAK